ncbi:MAG TPA: metallophosphoesterase [Gemmatimonadales bacterium]|jgi:Icc-related predicted phosphoesterase|nr:metallophosphoesterase [Gemmatimonadales bacterium]
MAQATVRVAAVADLHYGRTDNPPVQPMLAQAASQAEVLVLAGDLTDHGLPEEARGLARELSACKIPMVGVLGNHDHESGHAEELKAIFGENRIRILDGDAVELRGIGFAGVKGFCGGFGRYALAAWGEAAIKLFVREALDEALKLETALVKLRSERRIAVMHYSPIQATVEGEPEEIYPFLGSSRLEDPINRTPVDAVVHGHAHHGCPEGRTMAGIPVYNVSTTLLQQAFPDQAAFRVLELKLSAPAEQESAAVPG